MLRFLELCRNCKVNDNSVDCQERTFVPNASININLMKKTMVFPISLSLLLGIFFGACAQKQNHTQVDVPTTNNLNKNPHYSRTAKTKLSVSDAEWKKILSPELYAVARNAETERAFTGKIWNLETKGTYYCAVCGNKLFRSNQKFISSCGWPSFFEQENKSSVIFKEDNSLGMQRTEALCGRCNSHLGHLFDDGPPPTGKRYCMNAISLDFDPDTQ